MLAQVRVFFAPQLVASTIACARAPRLPEVGYIRQGRRGQQPKTSVGAAHVAAKARAASPDWKLSSGSLSTTRHIASRVVAGASCDRSPQEAGC